MRDVERGDSTSQLSERTLPFAELVEVAQSCRRCPRMNGRTRVLGSMNGPLSARILFIAEAPGRFGADASGAPLAGDRTGQTFERLLSTCGLSRGDIFITNAVICNPRDSAGRNDRPTQEEIANCGEHLRRLIGIIEPEWVATLGGVALDAVARIEPHAAILRRDVGVPVRWYGRWLIPLYHPGPRALIRRSFAAQQDDYRRLAMFIAGGS